MTSKRDEKYFKLITGALRVCANYRPMFGKGRKGGMTFQQFRKLYGSDPFYKWVGLDSPLMYAAHKTAGGMTSVYRQLGIGCQWVFTNILKDTLGLSETQATWTYKVPVPGGKPRTLSLDGRIEFSHIKDAKTRTRIAEWTAKASQKIGLTPSVQRQIKGLVFEVRQGYKSMDSKRQNADIANASNAYANLYLPVLLLLSTQIDQALIARYSQSRWVLLVGKTDGTSLQSTYVFCRDVLRYDLARFFSRSSARIKTELKRVLATLLKA